ncbi:probable glutathione peroxidase 2 [Hibiscus syriacus]|uniref:probable glutathione peroxidase 2 n=1 Tax=Hibiscus syriacus TaxID=106335 RepID=UPI00192268EC|nr:probable glutathione peroxidase 2 [Hibiscus syriacus]
MDWDCNFTNLVALVFLGFSLFLYFQFQSPSSSGHIHGLAEDASLKSIYHFTVKDIHGNDVSLSEYEGKVLVIMNVASKCGLTQSNYKELNVLYEKHKNKGFEILAFPCNQFAGQEPGTNKQIQEAACTVLKAEFPIFDKVVNTFPLLMLLYLSFFAFGSKCTYNLLFPSYNKQC